MDTNNLIALYLSGTLSHEAQQQFNHLMATDANFKKEVEFQSNLKTVISKEEQEATKRALTEYENEFKNSSSFNRKSWMVAASVIMLLGFSFLWLNSGSIDNNALFEDYFEPYRNVVQPVVRGEQNMDSKSKAFEAYENKDYQTALDYFNVALEEKNEAVIKLYKGITQLQLDNIEDAIVIFEELENLPNNLEAQHNWYLALAYLKNNELENAKATLQKLNSRDSAFKNEEVDSLLKALD